MRARCNQIGAERGVEGVDHTAGGHREIDGIDDRSCHTQHQRTSSAK